MGSFFSNLYSSWNESIEENTSDFNNEKSTSKSYSQTRSLFPEYLQHTNSFNVQQQDLQQRDFRVTVARNEGFYKSLYAKDGINGKENVANNSQIYTCSKRAVPNCPSLRNKPSEQNICDNLVNEPSNDKTNSQFYINEKNFGNRTVQLPNLSPKILHLQYKKSENSDITNKRPYGKNLPPILQQSQNLNNRPEKNDVTNNKACKKIPNQNWKGKNLPPRFQRGKSLCNTPEQNDATNNKPIHETIRQFYDAHRGTLQLHNYRSSFSESQFKKCSSIHDKNCEENISPESTLIYNFRALRTIPSNSEILFEENPILFPAVIDRPYEDVNEYLDIQFRLLKEDTFRGLRRCLSDYLCGREIENGKLYRNAYLLKIEHSFAGKLWYFVVSVSEPIHWNTTKCLEGGSLICLTCDNFQSFQFASIHTRIDDDSNGNVCCLALSFENMTEPKHFSYLYDIIESSAYYESYYYAAENLKKLNPANFPFGNCLLDFKKCNQPPIKNVRQHFRDIMEFKNEISEIIQNEAFDLALQNKIALIQGPPGTGKSFLANQIANFLIKTNVIRKPLIIMCYTNHALDQFLERMLAFTTKLIRIGGGSQSEKLQTHNLRILTKSLTVSKRKKSAQKTSEQSEEEIILEKAYLNVVNLYDDDAPPASNRKLNEAYGRTITKKEILNRELRNCATMVYPFRSSNKYTTLEDTFQMDDLFLEMSLGENVYNVFKGTSSCIKLYQWLQADSTAFQIYNTKRNFKDILIEELTICYRLHELELKQFTDDVNAEKFGHNKILLNLLKKLCTSNLIQKNKELNFKLNTFMDKHLYLNEVIFRIFLNSVVRYNKEHKINLPKLCDNLWKLELMERWELISIITEAVLLENMTNYQYKNYIKQKTEPRYSRKSKVSSSFHIQTYNRDLHVLKEMLNCRDIDMLKRADIVGITTTGASKNFNILEMLKPTTVIIEEAAEVLESHVIASLLPSISHLVLIGDHFQLRPLPNEQDLVVNYNLEISLFERLFNNGVPSKRLEVQHRMRPTISCLLVPEFYPTLRNHPSVYEFENIAGVSSNVFFLQHSKPDIRMDEMKSYANPYESKFILTFCEYLVSQGHEPESITILTTYNGQLQLIKNQIYQKQSLNGVLVTTVDGYQGEENDIILLSFVRSNPQNVIGFIQTKNRICVALSRARKGLYCIGNFKMFASRSTIWTSLVNKLKTMNSFGETIKIHCHNHPQIEFTKRTPEELQNHMKRGCQEVCNKVMSCNHTCRLICHSSLKHSCSQCTFSKRRKPRRNRR